MLPAHLANNIRKQVMFYLKSTFNFRIGMWKRRSSDFRMIRKPACSKGRGCNCAGPFAPPRWTKSGLSILPCRSTPSSIRIGPDGGSAVRTRRRAPPWSPPAQGRARPNVFSSRFSITACAPGGKGSRASKPFTTKIYRRAPTRRCALRPLSMNGTNSLYFFLGGGPESNHRCASFFGDKASMTNGVLKTIWPTGKPVALDKLMTVLIQKVSNCISALQHLCMSITHIHN